jgi:hypothetical protein
MILPGKGWRRVGGRAFWLSIHFPWLISAMSEAILRYNMTIECSQENSMEYDLAGREIFPLRVECIARSGREEGS